MATKNTPRRNDTDQRRFNPQSEGVADWANANPALLHRAICNVAATGGAIRFGYTRDGGAYAVGILGDGEPYTTYFRPSEDLDAALEALCIAFDR